MSIKNDQNNSNKSVSLAYLNQEIKKVYGPLTGFVARLTNPSMAQDILHDAIVILLLKVKENKLNNPHAIKPFLYATVKWLARSYRKYDNKFVDKDMEYMDRLLDESISPLSQLEQKRLNEDVLSWIEQLKFQRDKDLLLHHYWYEAPQDFQYEYDVSVPHYSRLLYRAKQRLKDVIEKRY